MLTILLAHSATGSSETPHPIARPSDFPAPARSDITNLPAQYGGNTPNRPPDARPKKYSRTQFRYCLHALAFVPLLNALLAKSVSSSSFPHVQQQIIHRYFSPASARTGCNFQLQLRPASAVRSSVRMSAPAFPSNASMSAHSVANINGNACFEPAHVDACVTKLPIAPKVPQRKRARRTIHQVRLAHSLKSPVANTARSPGKSSIIARKHAKPILPV